MMENAGMYGSSTNLPKMRGHKWVFGVEKVWRRERKKEWAAMAGKWNWEEEKRGGGEK
jgi:hypothetical protein